jgi:hypothetical protein
MRRIPISAFLLLPLFCLAACGGGGGKSPSEPPPPPPPPPPITVNAITILSLTPAPGASPPVGIPIRATFSYETVDAAGIGCFLTKNGMRVGGSTGRVVGGNERGMEVSLMDIDRNNYDFLRPDKKTDGVVCEITKPSGLFEPVKSVSMAAVYFWHL